MIFFIRARGAARLPDRKKDANFSFEIFLLRLYTRKRMSFVNTTAIAYRQNHEALADLSSYAIAVVFTNVMHLRVVAGA